MKKYIFVLLINILAAASLAAQCLTLTNCPAGVQDACDYTPNDANLWAELYWWDPLNQVTDMPEGPVDLCLTVANTCAGNPVTVHYELHLDLDGNGTQESVVTDALTGLPGGALLYDNAQSANYTGGVQRTFDERPVTAADKYRFALQTTVNGNQTTACLRWNSAQQPGAYVIPQLPYGTHRIRWTVVNDLGETATCEYNVVVRDCKVPTVVCLNGLSVNIMPTGMITLWATDFLQYAEDNASPTAQLRYGVRKVGTGTGFPFNNSGEPNSSITYTCDEVGTRFVELWAIDRSGNADYCQIYVLVQDNIGNCPVDMGNVKPCARMWCNNAVVNATFDVGGVVTPPGFTACDDLLSVPAGADKVVLPSLDYDPQNGVDVFDLIKMRKHILAIQPIDNPYALIASDVNSSLSLTTFDMVIIQRLMLGAYTEFPNTPSWKFVDANYVFTPPYNLSGFPISNTIPNLPAGATVEATFVAVKIGDVNCSAQPGLAPAPEDRGPAVLLTMPDRLLEAGESVDVPLVLAEGGSWTGLQLALEANPDLLELESVASGEWAAFDNDAYHLTPDRLALVWYREAARQAAAHTPLLTLRVRARTALRLSEALQLDAHYSVGAAGDETSRTFALAFQRTDVPAGAVQVFAPRPNPTAGATVIPVQLPQEQVVTLEITNMTGAVIYRTRQTLPAGLSTLTVPAEAMPDAGVFAWRVLAGDRVETGLVVKH